jgi:hypothetical protein
MKNLISKNDIQRNLELLELMEKDFWGFHNELLDDILNPEIKTLAENVLINNQKLFSINLINNRIICSRFRSV